MSKKKLDFFKEKKRKKGKDETMELAKDVLVLAGGVAIIGAGLSLLD